MDTSSVLVTERNSAPGVPGCALPWITGSDDRGAAGQTLPWKKASSKARQLQHHWMDPDPSKSLDNLLSLTLSV